MRLTVEMYVTFFYLLCLFAGSYGSCTDMNTDSTKVATMCTDSVVSGTLVFIDASSASSESSVSGLVCSCSVKAHLANTMNITSYYRGVEHSDCVTTLSYVTDGQPSRNVSCKNDQFEISAKNLVTNIYKTKSPYDSNYCAKLELIYCSSNEYQCSNGACIHGTGRCDNIPDCTDGSDEQNCNTFTCSEGQVACDDGHACIHPNQRCDGNNDCPDASDEPANCGASTSGPLSSTSSQVSPLIIVTCTKNSGAKPPQTDGPSNVVRIILICVGIILCVLFVIVMYICYRYRKRLCLKKCNKVGHSDSAHETPKIKQEGV